MLWPPWPFSKDNKNIKYLTHVGALDWWAVAELHVGMGVPLSLQKRILNPI